MTRISESVFSRHRGESNEWLLFYNNSGAIIPAGAMMEIDGVDTDGIFKTKKPTRDDLENVLVNGDVDAPVAGYGQGWEAGTHPAIFDGTAPVAGDRIGSQTSSWNAKKSDIGTHLVRAVSGSTAFVFPFRQAATSLVYLTECAVVKNDSPDTTFLYNASEAFIHASGDFFDTDIDHRFVWKWNNQISSDTLLWPGATPIFDYLTLGIGKGVSPHQTPIYEVVSYVDVRPVTVHLQIDIITEDFDASTITWNTLSGLSKSVGYPPIRWITRTSALRLGKDHPTNPSPTLTLTPWGGPRWTFGGLWDSAYNPCYGMVMYVAREQSHKEWKLDFSFETSLSELPAVRNFHLRSTEY